MGKKKFHKNGIFLLFQYAHHSYVNEQQIPRITTLKHFSIAFNDNYIFQEWSWSCELSLASRSIFQLYTKLTVAVW